MTEIMHINDLLSLNGKVFVDAAYRALLKRPADENGLSHFVSKLREGEGKAHVIAALAKSEEAAGLHQKLNGLAPFLKRERSSLISRWWRGFVGISRTERILNRIEFSVAEQSDSLAERLAQWQPANGASAPILQSQLDIVDLVDPVEVLMADVKITLKSVRDAESLISNLTYAVRASTLAGSFRNAR